MLLLLRLCNHFTTHAAVIVFPHAVVVSVIQIALYFVVIIYAAGITRKRTIRDHRIGPRFSRVKTFVDGAITDHHLTVTQFKVQQEQARLAELTEQNRQQEQQAAALGKQIEKIQNQQVDVAAIEKIEAKPVPLSSKVILERSEYESLAAAAKKYVTTEKKESKLQKALDAANRLIARLKEEIAGLKQELSEYKSVRSKLRTSDLERENAELRGKIQRYEDVIQHNNLWHFFRPRREKTAMRDDAR